VQRKENNMKTTVTKWATKAAGAGAIALLLATPSFAQSRWDGNRSNASNNDRGRQTTGARNGDNRQANNGQAANQQAESRQANSNYRDNQRVTLSGKVSSFSRERDGYRVQLDRGQSYYIPRSSFGNRDRDLRAGVSISLGGIFRGGAISFDAVSYPNVAGYGYGNDYAYGNAYGNGYVTGVIASIDYRGNTLVVRDQATGRLITAEMTAGGRSNARNLRPGDFVQMSGAWIGGGVFDVAQINRG
jgi:hypothetical protein